MRSTTLTRTLLVGACLSIAFLLAACGGGGADGDGGQVGGIFDRPAPTKLHVAAYQGGVTYAFGQGAPLDVTLEDAPDDTDFSRWATLHDGSVYRLYFMRQGSATTLYQFGYDESTNAWRFGFRSIDVLEITGMPAEADPSSFAMLHDGSDYRLYMRGRSNPTELYQAGYNPSAGEYQYGFRSIAIIDTTGLPADADLSRWGMLYDGRTYRQYVAKTGTAETLYQCGFDGRTYDFGHDSISELQVVGAPGDSELGSFAMLHDGSQYRFHHLAY